MTSGTWYFIDNLSGAEVAVSGSYTDEPKARSEAVRIMSQRKGELVDRDQLKGIWAAEVAGGGV